MARPLVTSLVTSCDSMTSNSWRHSLHVVAFGNWDLDELSMWTLGAL